MHVSSPLFNFTMGFTAVIPSAVRNPRISPEAPPPKSLMASPLLVAASAALLVVIPSRARNLLLYPRAFAHPHRVFALPSATPTLSLPKKKTPRTSPPEPQIRVPQPFASPAKGWVQPATDARTKWEAA